MVTTSTTVEFKSVTNGKTLFCLVKSDWVLFAMLIAGVFSWFFFQCFYYATHINFGIAPDEEHHLGLAQLHFKAPCCSLVDGPETHRWGPVSTIPFLYHLLMGKLLYLNIFGVEDLVFLRWISLGFSVAFFASCWALAAEVSSDRWVQLLSLGIVTNIPMLVFLFGAVHYDNFINTLAVLFILYLVRFLRNFRRIDLLLMLSFLMIGTLVKVTFLPLCGVLIIAFAVYARSIWSKCLSNICAKPSHGEIALIVITVVLLWGNLELYGRNLLIYGAVFPQADQVLGVDVARDKYAQFRLHEQFLATVESRPAMGMVEYLSKYLNVVDNSIFGILGHKSIIPSQHYGKRYIYAAYPCVIGALYLILWLSIPKLRASKLDFNATAILWVAISALFYTTVVMLDSYHTYTVHRVFGSGLQGRYLFPVLMQWSIIFAALALCGLHKLLRPLVTVAIIAIFIAQGFPKVQLMMTSDWFIVEAPE